jgi:hypothetical protein
MNQPPLTLMVCPFIYPFLASMTATSATSPADPYRPIGIRSGRALGLDVTISVSTSAGAMAFTVIPSLANLWA